MILNFYKIRYISEISVIKKPHALLLVNNKREVSRSEVKMIIPRYRPCVLINTAEIPCPTFSHFFLLPGGPLEMIIKTHRGNYPPGLHHPTLTAITVISSCCSALPAKTVTSWWIVLTTSRVEIPERARHNFISLSRENISPLTFIASVTPSV